MSRTILDIAREAAERDNTAPPPASLFASGNNKIARQLRLALKDTMRDYMRKTGWQGESELHSTWTFTTQPGVFAYPLPPDYLRAIPRTEQRDGWPMGLWGPATPQTYAEWLSGLSAVVAPMGWRIRNNLLYIEPAPTAAEVLSIDYVSRYPVVGVLSVEDIDTTSDPIKVRVPLVPREGYLQVDDASLVLTTAPGDARYDEPGYDTSKYPEHLWEALRRAHPLSGEEPLPKVRRPEFTEDTDQAAFDDDYLLSLGMTYRLRRSMGLAYAEHAAEYEEEMDTKMNADAAVAGRPIHLGDRYHEHDTIPLGNGKWLVS